MSWQFYPWYHIPAFLSTLFALALAGIAWKKRCYPGAFPASIEALALALWVGASIFEIAAPDVATKLFWIKIEYPGLVTAPILWLIAYLHFLGHHHFLNRRNIALIFVIPAIAVVLNWTNPAHHLFYARTWLDSSTAIPSLGIDYGICGIISILYGYLLAMIAATLGIRKSISSPKLFGKQALIVCCSACIPLFTSILFVTHHSPIPHLDLTPLAFILSCGLMVLGIFHLNLWDVIPIAHQQILGQMCEGMLVCDHQDRVVEINPAACRILSRDTNQVIGQPLQQVLPDWLKTNTLMCGENALFSPEDSGRVFEMRISPLKLPNHQGEGQLVVLRDVTSELTAFEERERNRVAQYLHDDIGQTLSGAMMFLSIARRRYEGDEELATVQNLLGTATRHARSLTKGLIPQPGNQSLSELAKQFEAVYGLAIALDGEPHLALLSKQQSTMMHRILRELLFNIVKHADCKQAWIRISLEAEHLVALVEDDGIGIQGQEGFGLTSIRGQLALIGGKMEIKPRPLAGTRVEIEIPTL